MKPKLVGIMGAAGAGKDTAAEYISTVLELDHDSFAAPLYAGLSAILNVSIRSLRDRDVKERPFPGIGKSPRQLLQTLGTEWGRQMVDEDLWLKLAQQRHHARLRFGGGTVISDVRFLNEANWIIDANGILLRISRPGVEAVSDHISELAAATMPADHTILNSGSKVDMYRRLDFFLGR